MRWDIARPEEPKTDVFTFLLVCVCVLTVAGEDRQVPGFIAAGE